MCSLIQAFEDLGNPFLEESGDLLDLDQSIIMPDEVVQNVRNVKTIGAKMYQEFLQKRIVTQEVAFTAPIHQCKLKLFKSALTTPQSNKSAVAIMKDQQTKVSQILLAAQSGRNISESVFKHESSAYPPSLTRKGMMHHGTKSEILQCIVPDAAGNGRPHTSAAVLDGPVLIQMLRPGNALTIGDYCTDIFFPYVCKWLENNQRVDIIWDVYSKTSLKSATRDQRGSGIRRRVTLTTKVPGNWAAFLRVDLNKQELFMELSKCISQMILPQVRKKYYLILYINIFLGTAIHLLWNYHIFSNQTSV